MTGIVVAASSPTERGRLYPRYDPEAGILAVESTVERPWPLGVNIDGTMLFDLDDRGVLANFDLHIPRNRWKTGPIEELRVPTIAGDLVFSPQAIAVKSFSLPVVVRTETSSRHVRIELGQCEPDQGIRLSASCVALLSASELVGFAITVVT